MAAGGVLHEEGQVDTSGCYGYAGGDPEALGSKGPKDVITSLYQKFRGVRLFRFNEFTSGDVWTGIKKLGNAEQVSYTTKAQSSGTIKEFKSGTPLAMGSCNMQYRPTKPTDDALAKIAVLTPSMLGRFVDRDPDHERTFLKVAGIDCKDDGGPMLRAMMEALQEHANAHPHEPFDHERHMPQSMRDARDKNPDTWAAASAGTSSSGARAGGGMSETTVGVVAAELRKLTDNDNGPLEEVAGSIVQLNDLIGRGRERQQLFPDACLLLLGTEKEVPMAKNARTQIPPSFLANLERCIVAAWPNCTVKHQPTRGGMIHNQKFNGYYVDGLNLKPPA
eukprot:CAMPEP_0181176026 /NCGR_PEP_ID=MMETSP1096-20121128/4405_1 /TAXON_ID=156174 ORGANISM="Chrysochromulina ericina, Strain CCMP281" /NCGR_SAMPLE_ID=MMETSP1096 /ASSEMBLY_ACC=CAM_ASM_000453 /LENGTH=334 /DNA_ID=CAMNT_0023264077 /DNA_START=30 /DNA_END=1034 /DNA_ORIENTATION=+